MESVRNNAMPEERVPSAEIILRIREADRALHDRLTEKMDTLPSGCILWRGSLTQEPRMWIHGRPVSVRRLLWETSHGPLPAGKRIRAYCGTDGCVNPEHLFRSDSIQKPVRTRVRPSTPDLKIRMAHLLYQGWTAGTIRVMMGDRCWRTACEILSVCLIENVTDEALQAFSDRTGIPLRVLKKIVRSQTRRDEHGQPRVYRPLSDAP